MITDYYEPAFPGQFVHGENEIESWVGISMRDYFAASANDSDIEAMIFRIAYVDVVIETNGRKEVRKGLPHGSRQIARYMHADAMIKARKQTNQTPKE